MIDVWLQRIRLLYCMYVLLESSRAGFQLHQDSSPVVRSNRGIYLLLFLLLLVVLDILFRLVYLVLLLLLVVLVILLLLQMCDVAFIAPMCALTNKEHLIYRAIRCHMMKGRWRYSPVQVWAMVPVPVLIQVLVLLPRDAREYLAHHPPHARGENLGRLGKHLRCRRKRKSGPF